MVRTIALISLGCAKNLVNSEQMLYLLDKAGYALAPEPDGADAVIINTCGFIDAAKTEAIDTILQMAQLKSEGRLRKIIVTGCLTERYKGEVMADMPEIDAVLGVGSFGDIVKAVEDVFAGEKPELFADSSAPVEETPRIVSTGPGWAYLRIAEGCNNFCAFCAIPYIRGRYRSRAMEAVEDEAAELAAHGVKELIVIAQDITRYGTDLYGKPSLAELCRRLAKVEGIEWIRLHYLYPEVIDDELIDEIANEPKIVKYLDIPIQHIDNEILRRMNRHTTGDEIRALFKKLRERIPGLVLRTSIIAGLPGEGGAEFEELCEFLREARIERAGVFPFSPEEGTPAGTMEHVPAEEAQRRADIIMDIQAGIMDDYCDSLIGTVQPVLYERDDGELGARWAEAAWIPRI
jgi:ribosomal protein S12 methylthiotransferase